MTDDGPILRVRDLWVTLPGRSAPTVRGVSFELARGGALGIMGESGAGKSLTASAIMGLAPPGARVGGSVRLAGAQLLGLDDAALSRIRGARISMVFQDTGPALTPVIPVGAQLAEAVRVHTRIGAAAARARAVELLRLTGLRDADRWAAAFPHEFSGGMRQRALLAMAIACRPEVIIVDEPTAALDPIARARIRDVLVGIRRSTGAALLVITHDRGLLTDLADRIAILDAGRIVEAGPVGAVCAAPRTPPARLLLGEGPPRPGGLSPAGSGRRARPTVLSVERLVVRHGRRAGRFSRRAAAFRAVDGVGFDVRAGETLALIGESGCGKTSTLTRILALRAPEHGRIIVLGRDVACLTGRDRRALRPEVQAVWQDPAAALDPHLPVGAIVAEPLRAHGFPAARAAARVRDVLRQVGLDETYAARYPGELSGGQRQRVGIARALATRPRLVLLDEPVSALDAAGRAGIVDLLAGLTRRTGVAYLLAAHDLALVRRVADRVAVLRHGRCVELGAASAVLDTPAHPYTRALVAAAAPRGPGATPERPTGRPVPRPPEEPEGREAPAGPPDCRSGGRCPGSAPGPVDAGRRGPAVREPPLVAVADDHRVACRLCR